LPEFEETSNITVAMLRAFVTLSKTLNLTATSESLGVTRQTARRHLSELEQIVGHPLFALERHEYALTEFGKESVAEAESILVQMDTWAGRKGVNRRIILGLESAQFSDGAGRKFYSQQHPVIQISKNGLPIMQRALTAWGLSLAQIEDPAMADVRPFLVVYRRSVKGWICVEIGERSAYAKWFGWAWSKSAIGRLSHEDNAGNEFNDFIAGTYARIYGAGGVRLDHLHAHLPRETMAEPVPISFQRLLLGCVFPDGTPGLAVLVLMTNKIAIDALPDGFSNCVPDDCVMDFEL